MKAKIGTSELIIQYDVVASYPGNTMDKAETSFETKHARYIQITPKQVDGDSMRFVNISAIEDVTVQNSQKPAEMYL